MQLNALTQGQAAALIGVTTRALREWHDAPRNADGSYPGPALVAYYVQRVTGSGDYDDQRQRLAAAQADKHEMDNALRRGQLADLAVVERFWCDCIANAKRRLLGMGSKLAPQLVNIGDANLIAIAIRSEARAALSELAQYDPGDPQGEPDVPAAAGADGEPVGGRGATPKQRKQRRTRPVADG